MQATGSIGVAGSDKQSDAPPNATNRRPGDLTLDSRLRLCASVSGP